MVFNEQGLLLSSLCPYSDAARDFTHILKLKEKVFDYGPMANFVVCVSVPTGAGRLLAKWLRERPELQEKDCVVFLLLQN